MTGSTSPTRLLIVDDHELLAQSLAMALRAQGFVVEIAELFDVDQLIDDVRADPPDLVLLDLDLGGSIGDGAALVRPFHECDARVLVVSGSKDGYHLAIAVEEGAMGVLSKSAPFETLVADILAAARGEELMRPEERHQLLSELRRARAELRHLLEPFERLSRREAEVLREVGRGKSVSQIAAEWVVSEATVRSQVRGILTKLSVSSQLEAVASALRAGWLDQEDQQRAGRRAGQFGRLQR
jgi:DNA-binding NarL/FixJ family response regulator